MSIQLSSNFQLNSQLPLDARTVVTDVTARNAIPAIQRYDGLAVYLTSTQQTYQLQAGILDANWVLIDTAGGAVNIYNSDGTLTGNRTVSAGTNSLTINNSTGSFLMQPNSIGINTGNGTNTGGLSIGNLQVLLSTDTVANTGSARVLIQNNNTSISNTNVVAGVNKIQRIALFGGTGSGFTVTDTIALTGMKYAADYSANFTARSIVDKGYVDAAVTGGSFIKNNTSLQSGANFNIGATGQFTGSVNTTSINAGASGDINMDDGVNGDTFNIHINSTNNASELTANSSLTLAADGNNGNSGIYLNNNAATGGGIYLNSNGPGQSITFSTNSFQIYTLPVYSSGTYQTMIYNSTTNQVETIAAGGSGTVTSVSVTTANGVSGSVATATTTPAITLTLGAITPTSVAASSFVTAGSGASFTSYPNTKGIFTQAATGATNSNNIGIVGEAVAVSGVHAARGVYGSAATAGLSDAAGLYGSAVVGNTTDVSAAYGVKGFSQQVHAAGANYGLYGNATNSDIANIGVYGQGTTTSAAVPTYGVWGLATVAATGNTGAAYGLAGTSTTTHAGGDNVGVYLDASGGANNYAVYANTGSIYFNAPLLPNGAAGTSGQVLTSGGAGAVPTWTTPTGTTYSAGTGLTLTTTTFSVNTSQNISTLSNLTGNGFVKTSGGTGALSIDTTTYVPTTTTVAGFALSGNVTLASLTATDATLTFSGSYNGSTARTIGINLANANTWTAAQTISSATFSISGAQTLAAWGTTGPALQTVAANYTDSSSAAGATVTSAFINTIGVPTITAANATSGSKVTYTTAASLYLAGIPAAGTNTILTNAYAIYINAGGIFSNGGLILQGGANLAGGFNTGAMSNANFLIGTTAGATNNTGAATLFGGASGVGIRVLSNSSTTSTSLNANSSYGGFLVASGPITVPNASTAAWLANAVINPIGTVTLTGTGAATNTATLYVGAAISTGTNNYTAYFNTGNVQIANGNLTLGTAGNKINITTGSNASAGTGTLVGGTVTISTTAVTASSLIFLTDTNTSIINVGSLTVSSKSAGVSFTVNSTNVADTSTFNWFIIN